MRLHWGDDREGWIRGARRVESANCDDRPDSAKVDLLVVHYISLPPGRFSGDAVERLFTNTLDCAAHPYFESLRGLRVSSHFLVRRRGELLQFVGTARRAWHAGASNFLGRERCNDFSIGVELEGSSEVAFTDAQYRRLAELTRVLAAQLPLRWIAGHSDIAPGRKQDPGPNFDWRRYESSLDGTGLIRPYRT